MFKKLDYLFFLILLVCTAPVWATAENDAPENLVAPSPEQQLVTTNVDEPGLVHVFTAQCSANGKLRVQVRDCAIPGDHWQATVKVYDAYPTTQTVVGHGSITAWQTAVAPSFGASPLVAQIAVRYAHGINLFPACYDLEVTCPGNSRLTLTDQGQVYDTLP